MAKQIKGLANKVLDNKSKPIKSGKEDLLVSEILANILYHNKSENGKDALRTTQKIMPMLYAAKNVVEFEDSDFDLVAKAVETNTIGYLDGVLGQVLAIFEEAK